MFANCGCENDKEGGRSKRKEWVDRRTFTMASKLLRGTSHMWTTPAPYEVDLMYRATSATLRVQASIMESS